MSLQDRRVFADHGHQALFFRFLLITTQHTHTPSAAFLNTHTHSQHSVSALVLRQAAASCWWRPCCLRTDEGPSWLSSSPSTCWSKRRAASARRQSTPTCSTRPASATSRCAGPARPTTPSWPSDELRLRPGRESLESGKGKEVELFKALERLGSGRKHIRLHLYLRFMLWSPPVRFCFSRIVRIQTFSGLRSLLDNISDQYLSLEIILKT